MRPPEDPSPLDTPRIGATLPLDDGPFGMPGCTTHTSVDNVTLLVGTANTAVSTLPIPDVAGLVGIHFFQQALVLDPAAGPALGAVMSDAAAAVVGN